MSRTMEQMMCFAVLGVVAFTLQGCGDAATMQEHFNEYANAAKGHLQDAQTAIVSKALQASEGCPPLLAATQEKRGELVSKVIEKVEASVNCQDPVGLASGRACQTDIAFELADVTMFYAEADPGFKNWVTAHESTWNQVKGMVNEVLQAEYMDPVMVMQNSIGIQELGTPEFKEFATKQFNDIIDATMKVFCPTSAESVEAAKDKDDPLVEAATATATAEAAAKAAAFKEEVADEAAAKTGRRLVAAEDIQI